MSTNLSNYDDAGRIRVAGHRWVRPVTGPRILIAKTIKHDHDHLRDLIAYGAHELDGTCEIHVKAINVRYRYEVNYRKPASLGGAHVRAAGAKSVMVERYGAENVRKITDWGPYMASGYAYRAVPSIANCAADTEQLITLKIPNPPAYACNTFPMVDLTYPGKGASTAAWPRYTYTRWEDDVIHLAAHEARHVLQTRRGEPHGEMEPERYACARLTEWRQTQPLDCGCPAWHVTDLGHQEGCEVG